MIRRQSQHSWKLHSTRVEVEDVCILNVVLPEDTVRCGLDQRGVLQSTQTLEVYNLSLFPIRLPEIPLGSQMSWGSPHIGDGEWLRYR